MTTVPTRFGRDMKYEDTPDDVLKLIRDKGQVPFSDVEELIARLREVEAERDTLQDTVDRVREAITWGARMDMNPTMMSVNDEKAVFFLLNWLHKADDSWRANMEKALGDA